MTGTGEPMTIGALSRRTDVTVKTLREYEDLGLIYTVGRSPGNYRLFDDEALWCVGVVEGLRSLGLTLAEIVDLTETYLGRPDAPFGLRLAAVLAAVRARTTTQIADLQSRLDRIQQFEATNAAGLEGRADLQTSDPRSPRHRT
jgi:DNA-binding transcriptional MerR regulator